MPLPVGSIRPSAALAAIAASTAEPPPFITSSAIWVASGCEVAAIACGAITSERVAKVWPVMRSAAKDSAGTAASTAAASRERARRRDTVGFRWTGGSPIFAAAAFTRYRTDVMDVDPGRKNPPDSAQNRPERSEFGFTETLSAATILVPQAIALDAAETDRKSVARVDTAEMAVFLSITCCITTRHREPTSKPPTPAPPRCVRFLCSYLLPNQQVRDEPACKQHTHRNSSKPAPAPVRVFHFRTWFQTQPP